MHFAALPRRGALASNYFTSVRQFLTGELDTRQFRISKAALVQIELAHMSAGSKLCNFHRYEQSTLVCSEREESRPQLDMHHLCSSFFFFFLLRIINIHNLHCQSYTMVEDILTQNSSVVSHNRRFVAELSTGPRLNGRT